MTITHKQALYVMYFILILCFVGGICFNYGYNKVYRVASKPIYVKYNNSVHKSLSESLQNAGINANQSQVEKLAKNLKAGERVAR